MFSGYKGHFLFCVFDRPPPPRRQNGFHLLKSPLHCGFIRRVLSRAKGLCRVFASRLFTGIGCQTFFGDAVFSHSLQCSAGGKSRCAFCSFSSPTPPYARLISVLEVEYSFLSFRPRLLNHRSLWDCFFSSVLIPLMIFQTMSDYCAETNPITRDFYPPHSVRFFSVMGFLSLSCPPKQSRTKSLAPPF